VDRERVVHVAQLERDDVRRITAETRRALATASSFMLWKSPAAVMAASVLCAPSQPTSRPGSRLAAARMRFQVPRSASNTWPRASVSGAPSVIADSLTVITAS